MRLLIVDDEPKIRNGLCRHFSAPALGFDAVETAENGFTALEKARAGKPDVILTDICMPGVNGLDMIEKLAAEQAGAKIVVISGHDNFAYAQRALRCGVHDYVLKPIDLERLDNMMRCLREELARQATRREQVTFALDSVSKNRGALVNDLFARIVRTNMAPADIEREASLIGVKIPDPAGLIAMKIVDRPSEPANEWEMDLLLDGVQGAVSALCAHLDDRVFFKIGKNNIAMLFAHRDDVDYVGLRNRIRLAAESRAGFEVRLDIAEVEGSACAGLACACKDMLGGLSRVNEFSTVVIEAKNYIAQSYHREDLTLQRVADAIQANPSYLSRLMHRQLGMSFVSYLTDVRMKKAGLILANSEKDVKLYEISQKLGFSSQHYFCRVFTKHYGVSPAQYRARAGGGNG
jgi:two-component system response regulator YesN